MGETQAPLSKVRWGGILLAAGAREGFRGGVGWGGGGGRGTGGKKAVGWESWWQWERKPVFRVAGVSLHSTICFAICNIFSFELTLSCRIYSLWFSAGLLLPPLLPSPFFSVLPFFSFEILQGRLLIIFLFSFVSFIHVLTLSASQSQAWHLPSWSFGLELYHVFVWQLWG